MYEIERELRVIFFFMIVMFLCLYNCIYEINRNLQEIAKFMQKEEVQK